MEGFCSEVTPSKVHLQRFSNARKKKLRIGTRMVKGWMLFGRQKKNIKKDANDSNCNSNKELLQS